VRGARLPDRVEPSSRKTQAGFGQRALAWMSSLFGHTRADAFQDRKAAMSMARKFDFHLHTAFRQPVDWGACMRTSVKWAACQLVGAPFKFADLNLDKTLAKQAGYEKAFQASLDAMNSEIERQALALPPDRRHQALVRAVLEGTARHVSGWVNAFTDARGVEHAGRVGVGRPRGGVDLASFLGAAAARPDAAFIVCLDRPGDGKDRSGHAVAVRGGSPPRLFDTALGELSYRGADFGRDTVAYLEATHNAHATDRLQYHVIPLALN